MARGGNKGVGAQVQARFPGGTWRSGEVTAVKGAHRTVRMPSIGGVGTEDATVHASQIAVGSCFNDRRKT